MKLSYHDQSDLVWYVIKNRQDNDVTNCIGLIYAEIETKLTGSIWSSAVYDENKIGQWHDWSYRCILCQKRNWTILTDWIGCHQRQKQDKTILLPIVQLWSYPKTIRKFREQSDQVSTMMKTW